MALSPNDYLIEDTTPLGPLLMPTVNGVPKARGYVPRDYTQYPREMFDPPSDISLIPRSEWSDRIREQESIKSRLSDLRFWESLDQNGQGYCHTADTEVLTDKGWIAWPDCDSSNLLGTVSPTTGNLEFQLPSHRHVYEYDGDMVYSTNRRIDFGVTPDHRMLVRKWDERKRTLSDAFSFVTAGNLGWYSGLMHAPSGFVGTGLQKLAVEGDREYSGDDFMALMGLIVSDGYAGGTANTRNWVSFASFRAAGREDIAALATRNGFHECPGRPGVWVRYDAAALATWVRANCYTAGGLGARNKRVPEIVKVATPRQIAVFLRYFDDRNRDGSQFYSTSKRLIDDLQELHLRVGKRSSIGTTPSREITYQNNAGGVIHSGPGYVLTVGDKDRLCLDRKKHIEHDRYRGQVYCATVPNGTLVTRRNGSVLISGNCWAYSTTACVMLLRNLMNLPHVRLSAHAVGCMVKGFRDEGGWCGLSAAFHRDKGCPSVQFWAEKSMSRNYDKPETWANAALHRVTEYWIDLTRDVYDQNLTFDQVATCLLSGIPCALDYNWWGHSVCGMDLVEVEPGSFGIRILNSWTDGWGERGTGVLRGNKAFPDGAVALRVTGASAA